jgi:hypothetical protein
MQRLSDEENQQIGVLNATMGEVKVGVENLTSNQSYAAALTQSLGDFRTENKNLNEQIRDSVKSLKTTSEYTTKVISRQTQQHDQEKRKMNVIIHRLPESGQMNLKQKLSDMCRDIHFNPDNIALCYRLGKPDTGKTRPIKVVLSSEIRKWEFLRQINNIKPDSVFATNDLNKEDREKDFNAIQRLKQIRQEDSTGIYRIKNFKITKQEGEGWTVVH